MFSGDAMPLHFVNKQIILEAPGVNTAMICSTRDSIRALLERQRDLKPHMVMLRVGR